MSRPLLGAHVSAAGGLHNAPVRASAMGAETMQIFGASPRQWKAGLPSEEAIEHYKEALAESGVKSVYLHAAYLVNLASEGELFEKSVENLATHFRIASAIEADGLIFHIGSAKEGDREAALDRVAQGIARVLKSVGGGKTKLVMENASGGGGKIGNDIDDLEKLLSRVKSDRVAVCVDTAHAFEAGVLDFTPEGIKRFFDSWQRQIGMDKLVALHVNDSKTEFASGSDRHENLGEGKIGLAGLRALAAEKRLKDTSWMLEVPGFDGGGPDKKNLDIMKGLFE